MIICSMKQRKTTCTTWTQGFTNSLSVVNMYWFLVITVLCRLSGFSSAWGLWSWSSLGGFEVWSSPWQCQTEMVPPFERSIGLHCLADCLEYWYRRLTLNMSIFICLRTCYTCWSYPYSCQSSSAGFYFLHRWNPHEFCPWSPQV